MTLVPSLGGGVTQSFIPTGLTWINVQAHDVLPSNSASLNATNMNALIQIHKGTPGTVYYFPQNSSSYAFGSELDFHDSVAFTLQGDGKNCGTAGNAVRLCFLISAELSLTATAVVQL